MKRPLVILTLCVLLVVAAGATVVSGGKEGTGHRSSPPTGKPINEDIITHKGSTYEYHVRSQVGTILGTITLTPSFHPSLYHYELHAHGLAPNTKYRLDYIAGLAPREHWEHVDWVTSTRGGGLDATGEMRPVFGVSDLDTAHFVLIHG